MTAILRSPPRSCIRLIGSHRLRAFLSTSVVAVLFAGCIEVPTYSAESLSIVIAPSEGAGDFQVLLPLLLEGDHPAAVYDEVKSDSPNASFGIFESPRGRAMTVSGSGNTTLTGSISGAANERFRAYAWSPPPASTNDTAVILFSAHAALGSHPNATIEVVISYRGESGGGWSGIGRYVYMNGTLRLDGSWQDLSGSDSIAPYSH